MDSSNLGNPFLTQNSFREAGSGMTRLGVVRWLLLYITVMVCSGAYVWNEAMVAYDGFDFSSIQSVSTGEKDKDGKEIKKRVVIDPETGSQSEVPKFNLDRVHTLSIIGVLGGFVIALIVIFNPSSAPFLGVAYAALEGLALGGVSAALEVEFDGIVMQAVAITVLVMIAMLALFACGIFRASQGFVAGVLACMIAVTGIYVVDLALQSFFGSKVEIIHSNSAFGIGFSVFVCLLAAFNFVIDFDTIEEGVAGGAPKYMEAYSAFGVLLTLVWLYLEVLRLLVKLKSREDD